MDGLKVPLLMVEKGLKKYFDEQIAESKGFEKALWERLSEFTMRPAKRVRAGLVYYGYKLFEGKNADILFSMMAVELFHAGLLIHDDIIDEDLVRRGLPTLHAELAKKYSDMKYGESMAICIGDVAMLAAEELLTQGEFSADDKLKAVKICSRGIVKTAVGEALDSELQTRGDASESEILEMLNLKTGIYTFANPLCVGAVLAGASEDGLKILEEYSLALGIAFQMTDDILGVFGDESKTGKSADSDIRQGKMTVLKLKAQSTRFNEIYGKKEATTAEIEEVRQIIREKSLTHVKAMIESYGKEARRAVEKMKEENWNTEAVKFLGDLVFFVENREN